MVTVLTKKYVYITKWPNEVERYVRFDQNKDDYFKVNIANAQVFSDQKDAEAFADKMFDFGYDRPEVVKVFDTRNAI